MEEEPIKVSIQEIINKAEEFYKNEVKWKAPDTYETAIEKIKNDILKLQKIAKSDFKKDLSIRDIVYEIISIDGREEITHNKEIAHLAILVGYKMEQEKQKEKENVEDWEMIVRLVLQELAYFSLPPNSSVTVMSFKELEEAIQETKKAITISQIKLFFLSGWIYFPLSLPFLILKVIWLICLVIKPTIYEIKKIDMKEVSNVADLDFKKIDLKTILEKAEKGMPKIMDINYFYHHIICGILMWAIIFKIIF